VPLVETNVTENLEYDQKYESFNKVPYIDLTRQNTQYKYEIKLAINRVLESGIYSCGPETEGFEIEFAEQIRAPYCIGVSSGIEAIAIGLRSLGVKAGDGVLTVANAGMHSTSAIRDIGAIPQFVEIDPLRLTMSPEGLTNAITTQSRAVIVTHLHGRVADINALQEIADQIAAFDEVIYLVLVTGSYDLHIEIVCRNQAHLLEFLTNKLHSVDGIKDSETFICMKIAKEVYTWTGYLDSKHLISANG